MKVPMKSSFKYITVLAFLLAMSNISFAQKKEASQRLLDAEDELFELIQVNKKDLDKQELKVWKKQKKYLERIISEEKEKDEFYRFKRNERFYDPYYSPYYSRYGFYPYRHYHYYPQRVIVVKPAK